MNSEKPLQPESESLLPQRRPSERRPFAVGAAGLEPATSCSQSTRATRLRYAPRVLILRGPNGPGRGPPGLRPLAGSLRRSAVSAIPRAGYARQPWNGDAATWDSPVLAGVLFTLVAVALMLSVKLIRAPSGTALPMLSLPADATCPVDSDATDCYQVTVTNAGSGAGQFVCNVFPATDPRPCSGTSRPCTRAPPSCPSRRPAPSRSPCSPQRRPASRPRARPPWRATRPDLGLHIRSRTNPRPRSARRRRPAPPTIRRRTRSLRGGSSADPPSRPGRL